MRLTHGLNINIMIALTNPMIPILNYATVPTTMYAVRPHEIAMRTVPTIHLFDTQATTDGGTGGEMEWDIHDSVNGPTPSEVPTTYNTTSFELNLSTNVTAAAGTVGVARAHIGLDAEV